MMSNSIRAITMNDIFSDLKMHLNGKIQKGARRGKEEITNTFNLSFIILNYIF